MNKTNITMFVTGGVFQYEMCSATFDVQCSFFLPLLPFFFFFFFKESLAATAYLIKCLLECSHLLGFIRACVDSCNQNVDTYLLVARCAVCF